LTDLRELTAFMAAQQRQNNDSTLKVLTLNAWGLWLVSKRRRERMAALAALLRRQAQPTWQPRLTLSFPTQKRLLCLAIHCSGKANADVVCLQANADVVCLQEVWVEADVRLLQQAAAEGGLPHSFYYLSGAIGSGLLVLSRHRIVQASGRKAQLCRFSLPWCTSCYHTQVQINSMWLKEMLMCVDHMSCCCHCRLHSILTQPEATQLPSSRETTLLAKVHQLPAWVAGG
jgi:hypothetical protein